MHIIIIANNNNNSSSSNNNNNNNNNDNNNIVPYFSRQAFIFIGKSKIYQTCKCEISKK